MTDDAELPACRGMTKDEAAVFGLRVFDPANSFDQYSDPDSPYFRTDLVQARRVYRRLRGHVDASAAMIAATAVADANATTRGLRSEDPHRTYAEQAARNLVGVGDRWGTKMPVDLSAGVSRRDGSVVLRELPFGEGRLSHRGGNWRIEVESKSSPERQRFTIAHELGHVWLASPDPSLAPRP